MKRVIISATMSDKIRKGNLSYDPSINAYYLEDEMVYVQFQDRSSNHYDSYSRSPKVESKTWARIWIEGVMVKQFEGTKYEVRQQVADYLDQQGL